MVETNRSGKVVQPPINWPDVLRGLVDAQRRPGLPTTMPPAELDPSLPQPAPMPSAAPAGLTWADIFRAVSGRGPAGGPPPTAIRPDVAPSPTLAVAGTTPEAVSPRPEPYRTVPMTPWEGQTRPSAAPAAAPGVMEALQTALMPRPGAAPPNKSVMDHIFRPPEAGLPDWEKMGIPPPPPPPTPVGGSLQNWLNAARYSNQGIFPWQKSDASLFPPDPNASGFTNQLREAGTALANVPFTVNAAIRAPFTSPPPEPVTPPTPTPAGGLPGIAIPRAPGSPFSGTAGVAGNPFATGAFGGGGAGGGRGLEIPLPGGPTAAGERSPGLQRYYKYYEGTGQNPRSSAFGPGQFIDSTFMEFLKDRYPQIYQQHTQTQDPGGLKQLKAELGNEAIDWYRAKNTDFLTSKNLPVSDQTIALSHRLGPAGAESVLRANPNTPLSQLFSPKVIGANPDMSGKTAGQFLETINKATDTSIMPRPPMHEKPPEQVPGAPADYSLTREYMDKARPKPLDQEKLDAMLATGVLSKAAAGAAAVDATKPGSFAAALGGAGAGASGGANEGQRFSFEAQQRKEAEERQYYTGRSTQELGIAGQQQDYGKYASEVAFKNATNAYTTATANLDKMHTWNVEEQKLTMPKVSFEGGNISVQYLDPVSRSIKVQQIPKSMMDRADDIAKMTAALKNLPPTSPEAQAITAYMVSQMTQHDPTGYSAMVIMRQQAIKHALATGGFGAFQLKPEEVVAFRKQADEQTKGFGAKLEEKRAAEQEILSGLVHNRMNQNEASWLPVLRSLAQTGNTYALLEYQRMMQRQGNQ